MARYIDNAHTLAAGKIKKGEPEFNGNSAALFFFQPVRIDAGQCLDQRRLSMVDVSGSTEDDLFQLRLTPCLDSFLKIKILDRINKISRIILGRLKGGFLLLLQTSAFVFKALFNFYQKN
jgi:hypothetical protein